MPDPWQDYLDWKAGPGAHHSDPMTEYLREHEMYPGEYVKDAAHQLIIDQARFFRRNRFLMSLCRRIPHKGLREKSLDWWWRKSFCANTPKRWLWLRFEYGMLQHPLHASGMYPFNSVTYDNLLWGTFVSERDRFRTKFWLWLTLITFRVYTKMPGTYYQKWTREQEDQRKKNKELQRKSMFRGRER